MTQLYDIIDKDGEKHIVIGTELKLGKDVEITTIPLRQYIEEGRIVQYNGRYFTIAELVQQEMDYILYGVNHLPVNPNSIPLHGSMTGEEMIGYLEKMTWPKTFDFDENSRYYESLRFAQWVLHQMASNNLDNIKIVMQKRRSGGEIKCGG